MSLITQCPACGTMFRIVPDQLRISEGWVRCGQCDEAFDANAYLRTLDEAVLTPPAAQAPQATEPQAITAPAPHNPPPPPPSPPPAPVASLPLEPEAPSFAPTQESPLYDWGPLLQPPPVEPAPAAAPADTAWDAPTPGHVPDLAELGDVSPGHDGAARVTEDGPEPELHHGATDTAGEDAPQAEAALDAAPLPSLSFMPAPAKASRLGSKSLAALSAVLSLLLLLQVGLFARDRLAVAAPALRPLLDAACDVLGCRIAPPRQIESIAIDNSAFTNVKAGVYKLSVTLKNAAAIELATPAVELTLSDLQDQTVLRRVLLPADFAAATSMGAGAELSLSLALSVKPEALANRVTGYKLLAFYP